MLLTAPGLRRHPSPGPAPAPPGQRRDAAELGAFALLVLGAGWVERHGAGLEGFWSVAPGLLTTLPVIVLSRAWRLPTWWLLLAASLPVSIILTAVLAPGGWAGSERSAAYGYGALAFVAVAAFCRDAQRRLVAVVALGLLVLDQFAQSWLAWWGSQDPNRMLTGSFYWHNQYGAYCAAGIVLFSGLALLADERRIRLLGILLAGLLMTGLLGSASRTAVLLAALGMTAAGVLALKAAGVFATARRTGYLLGTALVTGIFLRSPLFFGGWSWPWQPLLSRSVASQDGGSYEPVLGNGSARLLHWRAGWQMALDHPLTGNGLQTFADGSRWYTPLGAQRSADPHNEVVRGLADGGLLGAAPVVAIVLLTVVLATVSFWGWWRRPLGTRQDAPVVAAMLAAGVLVAHALVDFDWSYPALTMAAGWSLALAATRRRPQALSIRLAVAACCLIALALTATLAGALVAQRSGAALAAAEDPATPVVVRQQQLRSAWLGWAPDARLPSRAVDVAIAGGQDVPAWTQAALRRRATVDSAAAIDLAHAQFARGARQQPLEHLRELARRDPMRGAELVVGYADLLRRDGRGQEAADTVARLLAQRAVLGLPVAERSPVMARALPLVTGWGAPATCAEALTAVDATIATDLPSVCDTYTRGAVVR